MKKEIITIAGKPGSGKSTTAKKLASDLDYIHFSSGDLFRQVGLEKGLDVMATTNLAEKDKSVDELVDQKVREMGKEEKIIVESRLAFHWIPKSFKVYLDLDTETSAKRMFDDLQTNPDRKASEDCDSTEEMTEKLTKRFASEKIRRSVRSKPARFVTIRLGYKHKRNPSRKSLRANKRKIFCLAWFIIRKWIHLN